MLELNDVELKKIISETVSETLQKIGVNTTDPFEAQKDFQHLRAWRKSTEAVTRQGLIAAIGILTAGLLGLIWQAIQGR